jgi:hypothetical protein
MGGTIHYTQGHLTVKVPVDGRESAVSYITEMVSGLGYSIDFYGSARRNQATEPNRAHGEL